MLPSNSSSVLDDSGYTSDNSPKKPFVGYDDLQAAIEAWAPKGRSSVSDNAQIGRECETPGVQRKDYAASNDHILRVCETPGGIQGNYYGNTTQDTQGNPSYAHKIVHKDLPKKRRGQEDPASLLRCPLENCNKKYRTPFWIKRHFVNDHGIVAEDPRLKQAITEWRERAALTLKQSKRDRRKPQNPTDSTAAPTNYNFQFLPDPPLAWSDSLSNPWPQPLPSLQSTFWNMANSSASLMLPPSDLSAHFESALNPRVFFHQLPPNYQHVPNQSMVHPSRIQRMSVQSMQQMHLANGYSNYQAAPQLLEEFTSVSTSDSHPIVSDSHKREVAEVVVPPAVEHLADERKKTEEAMRRTMRAISPIVVPKEEETRRTEARSPPLTYTTLLPWKPSADTPDNGTPMTALQLIQSLIPPTDGIPFGDYPGTLDYDPFAPLNWGTVDTSSFQPINNHIEEDE